MNRLLISTALAGLLALSGGALAQPGDHDHGGPGGGHEQHGPAPGRPAPGPGGGHDDRQHMDQHFSAGRQHAPAAQPAAVPPAQPRGPAPNNAMRGPNNAMRGPAQNNAMRGPGPSQGNRGGGRDYSSYHRNFSAPHHFRAPTSYRRPSGWYAHRWTFGEFLPRLFWAPNYWLTDYEDFDLAPPPPGTVWVRDGDDALLIDQYSGEIIQVEYGVFY